jgi:hypothetical protein
MDTVLTAELTAEEKQGYDDKCIALATQYNVPVVHCCVIITPVTFERCVCYLKEPNFMTKLTTLSKMTRSGIQLAANELREACLIKEVSDPITYGESWECDPYKIGVVNFCMGLIDAYNNVFDKKK